MRVPRVLIAAAGSGAGKTTLAAGLMALLARQGCRVQPFKAGPDYIDPGYHSLACGRVSRNLDPWWFDGDGLRELFLRAVAGADLAVIEGVMGLFDGCHGRDDSGSSAELARLLATPVVLVVDAWGMGRSAAALVHGCATFDPRVAVRGVIFNRVAGPRHYEILREAVQGVAGVRVLGCLPREESLAWPERHLGLVAAPEQGGLPGLLDRLAARLSETVDLDALWEVAREAPPLNPLSAERRLFPSAGDGSGAGEPARFTCRVAVARDEAFHFYYQDGLDYLAACGAELVPFSPKDDTALPEGIDGLYIGGGFPEVFAADLAANEGMKAAVRRAAARGMPVYAECGGLMYLTEAIVTRDGSRRAMAGVLPGWCEMRERLAGLGYVEGELLADTILGCRGERVRGHEFHYSVWRSERLVPPAYRLHGRRRHGEGDGYAGGRVLASYLHLHFAANPAAARRFVGSCLAYRRERCAG